MQSAVNTIIKPLGRMVGTGFGSGLSPVAPGTAGSLLALAIYYFIPVSGDLATLCLLAGLVAVGFPLGVWATGLLCTPENPDPGKAVWDEFVGMWATCLLLPREAFWLAAAFICFRVLDITKPWPARRLEGLPGGWGIMADDLAVGIYGALLLNGLRLAWQTWG